jgi:hypothetical protein
VGCVENSGQGDATDQGASHWSRLGAFLQTDPRDAGCDTTMEMIDVYAELVAAGSDPAARFPGLHAHFLACGPCAEDLEGLLIAITEETPSTTDGP